MLKYRKGELQFYKSSIPKELKKYLRKFPENKEYVEQFLKEYEYSYTKKSWIKKEPHNTFQDRLKGEQ